MVERVLFRQTATGHTTAIRSLVHRALTDMERWRRGPGLQQECDLMCYWDSWNSHMASVSDMNERVLGYVRSLASSAASFHASAAAAAKLLEPITVAGHALAFEEKTAPTKAAAAAGKGGAAAAAADAGGDGAGSGLSVGLSISAVTAAAGLLADDMGAQMLDLATLFSRDIAGDLDGPLGKRGDGKLASFEALADRNPAFKSGAFLRSSLIYE